MNNIIDIFYAISDETKLGSAYKKRLCRSVFGLSKNMNDQTKCGISIHCSNCIFNTSKVDNIPKLRKQLKKID